MSRSQNSWRALRRNSMWITEMTIKRFRWLLPVILCSLITALAQADPKSGDLRELELKLKEVNLELAGRISALEAERNIVIGVLGFGLFALPFTYFRLLRQATRRTQQRLEEIVESRPGALIRLLEEQDADRRLRRETRVIVVSKRLELERVLRQHGFKNVRTKERDDLEEALEDSGAVVLDLVQGVDEQQATAIIQTYNLEHVLAFCHDRVTLPPGKTTFANSHMTLFNRLLELIRFMDAAATG